MRNLLRARDMHTSFSLVNVVKLYGHRAQWRLATVEETRRQFCARARVPPLSDRADLVAPGSQVSPVGARLALVVIFTSNRKSRPHMDLLEATVCRYLCLYISCKLAQLLGPM